MTIEEKIEILQRVYRALEKSDTDALDALLPAHFKTVDIDSYRVPIDGRQQFYAHVGSRTPGVFEFADVEPLGDALIVDSRWTPDGGLTERWRSIWTFWNGQLERVDARLLGYLTQGSPRS